MNKLYPSELCFLLSFVMACTLYDLRYGKIRNPWVLGGLLGGFSSKLILHHSPPWNCLPGFLLPYLLLGVLVLLRMMGGGDVKLLSVIGLFLGPAAAAKIILGSIVCGAIFSLLLVIRRKNLFVRLKYLHDYLISVLAETPHVKIMPYRGPGTEDGEFCFSVPILFSLLFYLLWEVL